MTCALGAAVPPFTPHAISVSLPTWMDVVGYGEGEKRVVDAMVCGYPRFFIHPTIQKLARQCRQRFGSPGEYCMLFPSRRNADACQRFMMDQANKQGIEIPTRLFQYLIGAHNHSSTSSSIELHIVLFPEDRFSPAKQFWQHTGLGVSSRLAERCLVMLQNLERPPTPPVSPQIPVEASSIYHSAIPGHESGIDDVAEGSAYLEECGRDLQDTAASAKSVIKRRIAGFLNRNSPPNWSQARKPNAEISTSTSRGIDELSEDDVFLYPTGMVAIWNTHQLLLGTRPPAKSVCFGFLYLDTLKILEKWGPGCHLFGGGLDRDLDELEEFLIRESAEHPDRAPVMALFTEFPSNPLTRSADLPRLRALADKYGFLIVVDDTIGNFVNVDVLPYADILVSSLSKVFSGGANTLGGSLVLNPRGKYYTTLKQYLNESFEDTYFDEDVIHMERNSRDLAHRICIIDENAEAVCDFLHSRSLAFSSTNENVVVRDVFYPKYITTEHYNKCKASTTSGYGGLFSLTFVMPEAARAFFDALPCYKGPSLGTNFTLACPYTILAHYMELDWAAKYGVEEGLVRVSVGMEDRRTLLEGFDIALKAAELTLTSSASCVA